MRNNKEVVVFTLAVMLILFCYSLFSAFSHRDVLRLSKVSILSDVLYDKASKAPIKALPDTTTTVEAYVDDIKTDTTKIVKSFAKYLQPKLLTNFNVDTTRAALPRLMAKLHAIKKGKKGKVRIAWFGDSLVEADVISMQFRKLIQQFMASYGVGYIPATSITSRFRVTAKHNWKGNWEEDNFKTGTPRAPLFLSGYAFYTADGEVTVEDETIQDTVQPQTIEKSLLCGRSATGAVNLTVNGQPKQYRADKLLNRLPLETSTNHSVTVGIRDNKLPVYGITMEPVSGIIIDNFSFRGISGSELAKFDTSFLQALNSKDPYDLIILEYGVNLMYHASDMDFSWYGTQIGHVIRRMQRSMPNAEFLIISTTDRAFFINGKWQSAPGINNLVKTQAEIAYKNGGAFYNMFENMGGAGTISAWAETNPPLSKDDRIHPTYKATQLLGNMIYESFMADYNKVK